MINICINGHTKRSTQKMYIMLILVAMMSLFPNITCFKFVYFKMSKVIRYIRSFAYFRLPSDNNKLILMFGIISSVFQFLYHIFVRYSEKKFTGDLKQINYSMNLRQGNAVVHFSF